MSERERRERNKKLERDRERRRVIEKKDRKTKVENKIYHFVPSQLRTIHTHPN